MSDDNSFGWLNLFFDLIISQVFINSITSLIEFLRLTIFNILLKNTINQDLLKKYSIYIQPFFNFFMLFLLAILIYYIYNFYKDYPDIFIYIINILIPIILTILCIFFLYIFMFLKKKSNSFY